MRTPISDREIEILHLLAWENSSKEIASQLYISEHTVISHRKNLMQKLDVKNTAGLIRKGFERGLLQISRQVAILILLASATSMYAQQELELRTDGVVVPRVDLNVVSNPVKGMMVYDTTVNVFNYYNGNEWQAIAPAAFEIAHGVVRSTSSDDLSFVFGRDAVPQNGQAVSDNFILYNPVKSALRIGQLDNSSDWSSDSLGSNSFALGYNIKVTGDLSTSIGSTNDVSGNSSFAVGTSNEVKSLNSFVMGEGNDINGRDNIALGSYNISRVNNATIIGDNNLTNSTSQIVIGHYNDTLSLPRFEFTNNPDLPILVIGNGTNNNNRSNALVVRKDGRIHAEGPSFIFGRHDLPKNGEIVRDTFLFFDRIKGALRGGAVNPSTNEGIWSPEFLGDYSLAYGYNNLASGSASISLGINNDATGYNGAIAIGNACRTYGDFGAIAMGTASKVYGNSGSVSIGKCCTTFGDEGATAIGYGTWANGNSCTVVGMYNDTLVAKNAPVTPNSPVLIVGNGDDDNTRSNALVIRKNGSLEGDGQHILYGAPEAPIDPSQFLYSDTLFYYDNMKGALKVGRYNATPGVFVPEALGVGSIAVGDRVNAIGYASVAFGQLNTARGGLSLTSGAFNHTTAGYSSALGYGLITNVPRSTVVGTYNDTTANPGIINPNANDPIFIVGNGDNANSRSNALVVRKNGRIQLGGNTVPLANGVYDMGSNNNRWNTIYATNGTIMTSDRRAKKNIQKLEYGLDEILQLEPVIYHWKEAKNTDSKKVGLIAQDISTIIPEVVHTPKNKEDLMGINYAELVPVLINAMQEQQKQITNMKDIMESQNKEIEKLKIIQSGKENKE